MYHQYAIESCLKLLQDLHFHMLALLMASFTSVTTNHRGRSWCHQASTVKPLICRCTKLEVRIGIRIQWPVIARITWIRSQRLLLQEGSNICQPDKHEEACVPCSGLYNVRSCFDGISERSKGSCHGMVSNLTGKMASAHLYRPNHT